MQDESSATVIEVPLSGADTPVLTGLQNPTGVAVDGLGNLYSADADQDKYSPRGARRGLVWIHFYAAHEHCRHADQRGNLAGDGNSANRIQCIHAFGQRLQPSRPPVLFAVRPGLPGLRVAFPVCRSRIPAQPTPMRSRSWPPRHRVRDLQRHRSCRPHVDQLHRTNELAVRSSGTEATFAIPSPASHRPAAAHLRHGQLRSQLSGNTVVYSSTPTLNASGQTAISLSGLAPGNYAIAVSYAGVTNTYSPSSASASFTIEQFVATGDSRTVDRADVSGRLRCAQRRPHDGEQRYSHFSRFHGEQS